jgi:phenylacetate-CoA ligase
VSAGRTLAGNVDGVAWPPVFGQNAHLAALAMTLQQTQWLATGAIAEGQGAQLAALVAHHKAASPLFKARLEAAGLVDTSFDHPDVLVRLPPLLRSEAQALGEAEPAEAPSTHLPLFEVQSSGSSGVPVKLKKTQLNQLMWMALTLRYHDWAEPKDYGRLLTIRPNIGIHPHSDNWGAPLALFYETGPVRRLSTDQPLDEQLKEMAAFRPDALIAYPSNLLALLQMGEHARDAFRTVSNIRTMGETLSPDVRDFIASETGARVFDCYSAEEIGYIAMQCPDMPLYHVMSESLIVEILDASGKPCRKGQVGRVVATDLLNLATPMIRYDTGDYAISGPPCSCGRGLPTLQRVMGRWRGMIVKPDGSRHWPRTGFHSYRKIAPVRQYQMIQHAVERIELRLAVAEPLTKTQHAAFVHHLQKTLGEGIAFEIITFADRLPPGPNGKSDEFISLVG